MPLDQILAALKAATSVSVIDHGMHAHLHSIVKYGTDDGRIFIHSSEGYLTFAAADVDHLNLSYPSWPDFYLKRK